MIKYLHYLILYALLVCGCGAGQPLETSTVDQCLRSKLFKECLSLVPTGPETVVSNDWAEVVGECASAATYQSYRKPSQIAQECRP